MYKQIFEELRKEIETIRTTTPYTYLSFIEDGDAVEQKKRELHKNSMITRHTGSS